MIWEQYSNDPRISQFYFTSGSLVVCPFCRYALCLHCGSWMAQVSRGTVCDGAQPNPVFNCQFLGNCGQ